MVYSVLPSFLLQIITCLHCLMLFPIMLIWISNLHLKNMGFFNIWNSVGHQVFSRDNYLLVTSMIDDYWFLGQKVMEGKKSKASIASPKELVLQKTLDLWTIIDTDMTFVLNWYSSVLWKVLILFFTLHSHFLQNQKVKEKCMRRWFSRTVFLAISYSNALYIKWPCCLP